MSLKSVVLSYYGWPAQFNKVVEECGELSSEVIKVVNKKQELKEITKEERGKIVEELADVLFTVDYLCLALGIKAEEIEVWQMRKAQRLEERLIKDIEADNA